MVPEILPSRRSAILALLSASVGMLLPRRVVALRRVAHPTPRVGITGTKVLTAADLTKSPHLVELFDGIRAIPQIADGIGCHCGCAELSSHYSLLSCYEGDAMAKSCPICQGEGRVTVRLAKAGKSLIDIRAAIDAQFG
ncbi:hypothetical protein [Gemmatimonas sp.]|uniref:hypothetical protein n=1 Tax=Gemmatimonas sp. TaxID=1962908 RepID=UPI0039833E44